MLEAIITLNQKQSGFGSMQLTVVNAKGGANLLKYKGDMEDSS